MTASGDKWVIAAAIAAITAVGIGLSLTIPLLSLRMDMAGYSAEAIGVQTALGALATLIFAPFVPRAAHILGVRQLMLAAIALAIACIFAFGLILNVAWWFPLRLLIGVALTILFVMSEYWINAAAPPERRGMVMGLYATSLALGFAAGPALLSFMGTEGLTPFLAAAAIFAVAAIPIVLAGSGAPELAGEGGVSLIAFLTAAPAATFAALTFGAIETGALSLLPVYALRLQYTPEQGALCVSLFAVGSVLFELPIGLLSDRMDRRKLLLAVACCGLVGAMAAPFATGSFLGFAAVLILWGGIIGGLYPLGLALLGSQYRGRELATANAAFVMFYSAGMLAGPPYLGAAMDQWSPQGLFIGMASVFGLYLVIVLASLLRRRDAKLS